MVYIYIYYVDINKWRGKEKQINVCLGPIFVALNLRRCCCWWCCPLENVAAECECERGKINSNVMKAIEMHASGKFHEEIEKVED